MRYLLWSGGWDSTYLLCKWARESGEAIQPVYIIRPECSNTPYERMARKTILAKLRQQEEVKAEILDPVEIEEDALPSYADLDTAYANYEGKIMKLYAFMGKAALLYPGIAIAAEAPAPGTREMSRTKQYILEGGLTFNEDGSLAKGETYDADAWTIFSGLSFPLIDADKSQMMDDVEAWGWLDSIFKYTWGCYRPGTDYCGVCGVCALEMQYGDVFDWRFTEHAKKDYAIMKWLEQNKGKDYAEKFRLYVMNNHSLAGGSSELTVYFDWLDKFYPNMEEIDAPAL